MHFPSNQNNNNPDNEKLNDKLKLNYHWLPQITTDKDEHNKHKIKKIYYTLNNTK